MKVLSKLPACVAMLSSLSGFAAEVTADEVTAYLREHKTGLSSKLQSEEAV